MLFSPKTPKTNKTPIRKSTAKRLSFFTSTGTTVNDSFEYNLTSGLAPPPSSFKELLNPMFGVPDATIGPEFTKDRAARLFDSMLEALRNYVMWPSSQSDSYPTRVYPNLESYIQIMPEQPSILLPQLMKQSSDPRVQTPFIDPAYIIKGIIEHIKSFPTFHFFDPLIIPKKIRQRLLEHNATYNRPGSYTASYNIKRDETLAVPLGKTLYKLGIWVNLTGQNGWTTLFVSYLKEETMEVVKAMSKSLDFCMALLVFYYYHAIQFASVGDNSLAKFWSLMLEERQGDILDSVSTVEETFVYKYNTFNGVVEEDSTNRLRALSEAGILSQMLVDSDYLRAMYKAKNPKKTSIAPKKTVQPPSKRIISGAQPLVPIKSTTPPAKLVTAPPAKLVTAPAKKTTTLPPGLTGLYDSGPQFLAAIASTRLQTAILPGVPQHDMITNRRSKLYKHYYIAYSYATCAIIDHFKRMITRIIIAQEFKKPLLIRAEIADWKIRAESALQFLYKGIELADGSELQMMRTTLDRCMSYLEGV